MTTTTLAEPTTQHAFRGRTQAPGGGGWSGDQREEVAKQLLALAALEADWDGYGAKAIDTAALGLAQRLIDELLGDVGRVPSVVPVPDGGVQLEWDAGPIELELEVRPGGREAIFICDDEATGQRFDGELPGDESLLRIAFAHYAAYRAA